MSGARMFAAVLPPQEVIDTLEAFVEPRREAESNWRWTESWQWHVTLAFLPSVDDAHYDALTEALREAAKRRPSFSLALAGAGSFPNPSRAKVLWTGVTGALESLRSLSVGARNAANRSGVQVDGAEFRPHLTLARSNRPQQATRWLRVFETFASSEWQVSEIELVESHLAEGPRGKPRYETLERFALA